MKKIIIYAVSLFLATTYPVQANNQTNDMNMSGPAVKIIKQYSGKWKGWDDGCVNCDKPLASDRVRTKHKKNKIKKRRLNEKKKLKRKKIKARSDKKESSSVPMSVRRGYCECNCKPNPNLDVNKESTKKNAYDVFNIKSKHRLDKNKETSSKKQDVTEELEKQSQEKKKQIKREKEEQGDNISNDENKQS